MRWILHVDSKLRASHLRIASGKGQAREIAGVCRRHAIRCGSSRAGATLSGYERSAAAIGSLGHGRRMPVSPVRESKSSLERFAGAGPGLDESTTLHFWPILFCLVALAA